VHSVLKYGMTLYRAQVGPEALVDAVVTFLRGKVSGTEWLEGVPCSLVLVFGLEYWRQLGAAGWTKADLREYLYPRLVADDGTPFHPVRLEAKDDLLLVAAGGEAYAGVWGLVSAGARPSTRPIDPLRR
jgi:hypothetical protein